MQVPKDKGTAAPPQPREPEATSGFRLCCVLHHYTYTETVGRCGSQSRSRHPLRPHLTSNRRCQSNFRFLAGGTQGFELSLWVFWENEGH